MERLREQAADARALEVLDRTLAGTGSVDAVAGMAEVWPTLPDPARRAVLDPLGRLAREGRQSDGTTCGSSVLTMLAAAGDPTLALWLATGTLALVPPPELSGATAQVLSALARREPEERFAAVQRVMKRRTNSGALLGLPWPSALGTPPWGAARSARYLGLRFAGRVVDDTDTADLRRVLTAVQITVGRGVPVPLYSGGDSRDGWAAALPRHVVLVTGATDDRLTVWEPGAGSVEHVAVERLLRGGDGPVRALGGWRHVMWAVLPRL